MTDEEGQPVKIPGIPTEVLKHAAELPEGQQAIRTITKAVNNLLLPIAAINFAFDQARDYFNSRFASDLKSAAKDLPPDKIIEPSPSVAAPAIQGLAFSLSEPDLKAMYLRLLVSAMDARQPQAPHPAFADIIRQLSPTEARMFKPIRGYGDYVPIVDLVQHGGIGIKGVNQVRWTTASSSGGLAEA